MFFHQIDQNDHLINDHPILIEIEIEMEIEMEIEIMDPLGPMGGKADLFFLRYF